jgi:PII-like signaling protein
MSLVGEKVLLRAYFQSADRAPHTPTYERLIRAARHEQLAGATVLRGILGAGYHGLIKQSTWSLVEHVPIIVEIVDDGHKIAQFVRGPLDELMVVGGMLTLERAVVMLYRERGHRQRGVDPAEPRACPNCGVSASATAEFCPRCGHWRSSGGRRPTACRRARTIVNHARDSSGASYAYQ